MNCPHCNNDLFELETYDNIGKAHECPQCNNDSILEYEEYCTDDFEECWDWWSWTPIIKNEHEL